MSISSSETNIDTKYYIGGSEATPVDQREKNSIRARHLGAEMLGTYLSFVFEKISVYTLQYTYYIRWFF